MGPGHARRKNTGRHYARSGGTAAFAGCAVAEHHQTMIQTLLQTVGLSPAMMIVLDALRKQCNVIDYSDDVLSESMVNEAVQHAIALIALADEWIKNTNRF